MKPPSRLTLLLVATAACGDPTPGEDPPSPEAEVRDSAGVRIVENPRPPSGSRLDWRVGPEPAVTIGKVEGAEPYLLSQVWDALVLADGRIIVVNGTGYRPSPGATSWPWRRTTPMKSRSSVSTGR